MNIIRALSNFFTRRIRSKFVSDDVLEMRFRRPAKEIHAKVDDAIDNMARTVEVNGFRKGKCPRSVVRQMFGGAIRKDIAREIAVEELKRRGLSGDVRVDDVILGERWFSFVATATIAR